MTLATAATTRKCEFCDKRGLPLLLVRDAIAADGAGAPRSADQPIELYGTAAHYTKRLLRSGYLNVYDEARKRWESYFVTPEGYFFKLTQTPGVIPVKPAKPFNCPDEGHGAVASCITVADPTKATKVWIGFSDVLWTTAVRKHNEDAAYRKRHMVAIDVKAALAGGKVAHARPIAQVSAVVAEYAMSKAKGEAAFVWNSTKFIARHDSAERLRKECETMRPGKALIVTVPDPVGITQELALLMQRNLDIYTKEPTRHRMLAADATISAIERGVRDRAKLMEKEAAEKMANEQAQHNWLMLLLSERARKESEEMRHTSPQEARLAADHDWKRYTAKFNAADRKKWQEEYIKELEAYDNKFVAPLARSHVTWIKSDDLAAYFECNYDTKDAESGAVYTSVFTQCAVGTQDKKAATGLYAKWLAGEMTDTRNLLLRAMVFNQDAIAQAVAKAVNVSVSMRAIPWDNLFATYGMSLERLASSAHDAVAGLIVMFAGPLARFLGLVLDGKYGVRGAVMALGLISGHPIVTFTVTDKRINFRRLLAKELLHRSGLGLDPKKLSQAIGAEMTLQGIEGVNHNGNVRATFIASMDVSITGMPAHLSTDEKYKWLAGRILNAAAVEKLNLGRFRTVINSDVRFGAVAGILQFVSLSKLIEDEEKALDHSKTDAKARLLAGIATLAATTGEVFGNAWKGGELLKYGPGAALTGPSRLLRFAKRLGIAAGLTVAIMDGLQAVEANAEGQEGLAWLYGSAAVFGLGLTLSIAFPMYLGAAAIPVIGILFLIVVSIGILIEYMKDNPVQDWLERCPWGILPAKRYPTEAVEQAEFLKAVKD